MNAEFMRALDALQAEKNIDKAELVSAIEASIESAYKKNYGNVQDVVVKIDPETGEITVFATRDIVEEVSNPENEISLDEARETDPTYEAGDIYRKAITPRDFGRIAAQNAKQLIMQRIKEAERDMVYNEYLERQDEVITGIVNRVERGYVYVDIGNSEGCLARTEQIPGEKYYPGQRLKIYLLMVRKGAKGAQLKLSRTHPGLVKRLFETEVPEIYDGIVDIVSISREAGSRTKISVKANDPAIDPVGACVGQKGTRVQNIIDELAGEKIDIIKYSDDAREYLSNALSPAKIYRILPNKNERTAIAIVDDFQLSLAIGKEGQNVRLAAKLASWKIDIKSKSEYDRMLAENPNFEEAYAVSEREESILDELKDELDDVLDIQIDENTETFNNVLDDLVMTDELDELDNLFE